MEILDLEELRKLAEEERLHPKLVARAQDKRRPEEQKEKRRAERREWFHKNKEHAYAYAKAYKLKRLEAKAARPKPDTCEACGQTHTKIVFDHNHTTGQFRGWLCDPCNVILGYAKDNPIMLQKLINYLKEYT
jgi:hypothetical protein